MCGVDFTGVSRLVMSPREDGANERFNLPVLGPLDSLTDGTNIPPPLDSPVSMRTTFLAEVTEPDHNSPPAAQASLHDRDTAPVQGTRGRTQTPPPSPAPTSAGRPSSIRRFLSRKSMNFNYNDVADATSPQESPEAPGSPGAYSTASERPTIKSKRSGSGWFRRLAGGGGADMRTLKEEKQRASTLYVPDGGLSRTEHVEEKPAPKLPELSQLKAGLGNQENSLDGEDMFKNIR